MSAPTMVATLSSYRNQSPYPFCPGCGHGSILDQLNAALNDLKIEPSRIVLVSDIGCSGLSDQYFDTSAFHGLHGRSITYATGIKLARPDLKVIVIMGDGGTGIGGAHLLNAARRNIGLTVLVFNNFNFGMTGGQHSTTTPSGAHTSTTPGGNLERPLDLCATVAVNGAGYVWRGTSFDKDLSERIAEAVRAECFALLDIWELCTAYFVPNNRASKRTLTTTIDKLGFRAGVLHREEYPEYAKASREASRWKRGAALAAPCPITPRFASPLSRTFRLVVAGSAGGKVKSAARLVGEAALLSGLWAAQRDDYPITVMTGHSIAEIVLSPRAIDYTAIARPDAMVLLSREGAAKVGSQLSAMKAEDRVFALPEVAGVKTGATVQVIDPAKVSGLRGKGSLALFCIAHALKELQVFPIEALAAAAMLRPSEYAEQNADVIRAAAGPL